MSLPSNPVDKVVQKIKLNIGRTNDSNVNDLVVDWINKTQQHICNRNNLWFMHAVQSFTWNQGQATGQNLPSDYKSDDSAWILDSSTNQYIELLNMDLEDYRRKYDDVTQSQPESYLIRDTDYIIRPVPDKTYDIIIVYWKYLPDLASGGSTNLLLSNYEDILEAGATYRGFRYLQEFDDAATWKSDFDMLHKDLIAENAERELAGELVFAPRTDVKGATIGIMKTRSQ